MNSVSSSRINRPYEAADTDSRPVKPGYLARLAGVALGNPGWQWVAAAASYTVVIAAWLLLRDRSVIDLRASLGVTRQLVTAPLLAVALMFAWRAGRTASLDLGTRSFWRLACGVLVLMLLTPSLWSVPRLNPAWLDVAMRTAPATSVPILMVIALFRLPSAPHTAEDKARLAFDSVTVVAGGLLVAWYSVATANLAGGRTLALYFCVLHGLALLDIAIFLFVSVLWHRTVRKDRAFTLLLIGGATLARFVAHVVAIMELRSGGRSQDAVLLGSLFEVTLLAAAAWHSSIATRPRQLRPVAERVKPNGSIVPLVAALPGFGLLLHLALTENRQPLLALVVGAVVLTVLAFVRQIMLSRETANKLAMESVRDSEARFRALVQHSTDVIMIVDRDGTFRYVSPSISWVFGYEPTSLTGSSLFKILHPDDKEGALGFLELLARSGPPTGGHAAIDPTSHPEDSRGVWSHTEPAWLHGHASSSPSHALKHEWRLSHADGRWMTVDNAGTNLLKEPGIQGLVLNSRDVTEQNLIKQQYAYQAFHDPLTDLANRSLFLYQVSHALSRASSTRSLVTVLFLDLDDFKTVNDSLGHAAGDRLLVDAAHRIQSCVRGADLIARLGGDEFAVLLEGSESEADALEVAERIGATLLRPFVVNGKHVFINASIGIAHSVNGESSDELVRNADVAMYVAKTRGKGQHVTFEQEMHEAALARLELEADLRSAIEREELYVEYQPVVALDSGRIIGAEALVRWFSRDRGRVAPGEFIPIAEATGLVLPIGRWVLSRACRDASLWARKYGGHRRISVNLSGRQLQDPGIVEDVRAALEESGLKPSQLILELTETMLMQNTEVLMRRLAALKALGILLAIDDFGTGYSSLSYLQRYPIDILKIDKAFVDVIDGHNEGPALASAIVAIGHSLRMSTVAEGIETQEQHEYLLHLGCGFGQGYLFSRPVSERDMRRLLAGDAVLPTESDAADRRLRVTRVA